MAILILNEKVVVSRQTDSIIGWEDVVIYEPVWINSELMESLSFAGLTIVRMVSGKVHEVRETPQEIMEML